MYSKNYGMAGAVSTVMFIMCAVLCLLVYFSLTNENASARKVRKGSAKS